jgi:hypothetical protein
MMKLVIALALIVVVSADTIKWTGLAGNNQWTSRVNWYPAKVPGSSDDVVIETGDVQCTVTAAINSLKMGTSVDGNATLTVFGSFNVATSADVDVNGYFVIDSGLAYVVGTFGVKGHLIFKSGSVGGTMTIVANGVGDLSSGAEKTIMAGGFINQGTVLLSGVLGFNQTGQFQNQGAIQASGSLQIMNNDGTACEFDASSGTFSYNGGSGNKLRLMVKSKFSKIDIVSGDVISMDDVTISEDLTVPAGSTVKTEAQANTTFGGSISGSGSLSIGGKVTNLNDVSVMSVTVIVGYNNFNGAVTATNLWIYAGTNTFNTASTVTNLVLVSGNNAFAASVNASNATVEGGILTGSGGFSASTVASFASAGINLGTTFTLGGSMSFSEKTLIAYATGGAIIISSGATVSVSSPLTLTGPPNSGSFSNEGAITVDAALSSANIDLLGQGSYAVSGSITTSSCAFSASSVTITAPGTLSGQTTTLSVGSVSVASGNVHVKIGNYTFDCPTQCKNVDSQASGQDFSFSA